MKLRAFCLDCAQERNSTDTNLSFAVPLQDSPVYRFTCLAGHDRLMLLTQLRFEVLAEVATQAIADGYYREAVTSFASCLERFREFAAAVIAQGFGIDEDAARSSWKQVATSSERQQGYYAMACLLRWKTTAHDLPRSQIELRNSVVHKGCLPTRGDALAFGQQVLDLVQPVLTKLVRDCAEGIEAVKGSYHKEAIRKAGNPEIRHSHGMLGIFQWEDGPVRARDLLVEVQRREAD